MREPHDFTVVEIRAKLQERNFLANGRKAEPIVRFQAADSTDDWRCLNPDDEVVLLVEANLDYIAQMGDVEQFPQHMQRELRLLGRKADLMRRELVLAHDENETIEIAGRPSAPIVAERSRTHVEDLEDLFKDFTGAENTFWKWEQQLNLRHRTYDSNEKVSRILTKSKLKQKVLGLFHPKPEHVECTLEGLLTAIRQMFDQRPDELVLPTQFKYKNAERPAASIVVEFPRMNVEALKYLLNDCTGAKDTFWRRNQQLNLLHRTCDLDEKASRILKASKLKEKALGWLQPKPELVEWSLEDLSTSMNQIFDHRPNELVLRKQFENRYRPSNGTFSEYCHEKVTPASHLPIIDEEIIEDYFIEGRTVKGCVKSGEVGRLATDWTKDHKLQINNVEVNLDDEENFLRMIHYTMRSDDNVHETFLQSLLDTGSAVSFVKMQYVPGSFIKIESNPLSQFRGINSSSLVVHGTVYTDVELDGQLWQNVRLLVVPDSTMVPPIIIGKDVLKLFKMRLVADRVMDNQDLDEVVAIMNINTVKHNQDVVDVVDSLRANFELPAAVQSDVRDAIRVDYWESKRPEVPAVKAELILVLSEHRPFYIPPRALSDPEKSEVRKILGNLLDKCTIRPSQSEYASPVVLVKKKNGETRMCVDYRALNRLTLRDDCPLWPVGDQLEILSGKKYFTLLKLKDGYNRITVAEESVKFTAFDTPLGQFEYLKMPFGLKTAPATFRRWINTILTKYIRDGDIVGYTGGFLIATETLKHHFKVLKSVLGTLVENKLELRLDKCDFLATDIEYLGYRVSENGVLPTERGIKAILNYPVPSDILAVQRFLGMCSYFRKFVEKFSIISGPLWDLLKENVTFRFDTTELESFNMLKSKLTRAPVLSIYNPNDATELHCDASFEGFGAALMQRKSDHKFHPIFYLSKRTTAVESEYHIFDLETLSVIYALRRFRVYVQGIKFKIITDCYALQITLEKRDVSPRIARWARELENYDYLVEHRADSRMQHVNALSRAINMLLIESNTSTLGQRRGDVIREIEESLEKNGHAQFEMRDGLVY